MKLRDNRVTAVLLAAGVLIAGANIAAYAATGGKFILGHSNSAGRSSALTNTGTGPALKLKSRASAPSLSVSSSKKVALLNADRLDGLDSTQLNTRVYRFDLTGTVTSSTINVGLGELPLGKYLASYSVHLTNSGSATNQCDFRNLLGSSKAAIGNGVIFSGTDVTISGTGVIDRSVETTFHCVVSSGTTMTLDTAASRLTFIPIDTLIEGSAVD